MTGSAFITYKAHFHKYFFHKVHSNYGLENGREHAADNHEGVTRMTFYLM